MLFGVFEGKIFWSSFGKLETRWRQVNRTTMVQRISSLAKAGKMETLRSNRIDLAQVIKSNRIRMLEVADIASVITRIGTLIGR